MSRIIQRDHHDPNRRTARPVPPARSLVRHACALACVAWLLASCAQPTIESRRQERLTAYQTLSSEQKVLVDQGQIRIGMIPDAVYIAWGPPSEILESESNTGHVTTWIFHGQWLEESRYWTYREMQQDGTAYLERYLESDYHPRQYIRAEIDFTNGQVARWRTLPRPAP